MDENSAPHPNDEDELGPGEQWIQDRMDQEDEEASWVPPEDGLPYVLAFIQAMSKREKVDEDVLRWLYMAFSTFYAEGGKPDLVGLLGLRGAANRMAGSTREFRDDRVLLQMDLLVFIGAEAEDAAWMLLEDGAAHLGLTYETLMRKYRSKRERTSPQILAGLLNAMEGGPGAFLANFKDTYMSPELLSMKRAV